MNATKIRIHPKDLETIRKKFPGLTDTKRMKVVTTLISDFDLCKLKPEISDSSNDRRMKKILGTLIGK